jgi:hypothetical protein
MQNTVFNSKTPVEKGPRDKEAIHRRNAERLVDVWRGPIIIQKT